MIPFGVVGRYIVGQKYLTRMPEQVFRLAFNAVLTLLATRLIYQVARHGNVPASVSIKS